jgi:hypothetical protein
MTVTRAIKNAERVLPRRKAPEGQLDPRWQAIIAVAEHIEQHPEEVWRFTRKWGASADADLRAAVGTCLLEHLLEHHFDRIFPLVFEACHHSRRFADTFLMCSEFGQTARRGKRERFRRLRQEVGAASANAENPSRRTSGVIGPD